MLQVPLCAMDQQRFLVFLPGSITQSKSTSRDNGKENLSDHDLNTPSTTEALSSSIFFEDGTTATTAGSPFSEDPAAEYVSLRSSIPSRRQIQNKSKQYTSQKQKQQLLLSTSSADAIGSSSNYVYGRHSLRDTRLFELQTSEGHCWRGRAFNMPSIQNRITPETIAIPLSEHDSTNNDDNEACSLPSIIIMNTDDSTESDDEKPCRDLKEDYQCTQRTLPETYLFLTIFVSMESNISDSSLSSRNTSQRTLACYPSINRKDTIW